MQTYPVFQFSYTMHTTIFSTMYAQKIFLKADVLNFQGFLHKKQTINFKKTSQWSSALVSPIEKCYGSS